MRRTVTLLLTLVVFLFVIASCGFAAPSHPPKALPAFSDVSDVLNLTLDANVLHVVSNDSLVTSVGSFPVFLIAGGPGHRFAIRTTDRNGSMPLSVNAGCVGCGGGVGLVYSKVFGYDTKELPRSKRAEKYKLTWNIPGNKSFQTGVLSGDNAKAGQAAIPIDVLLLEKGIKLDFYEYVAKEGLRPDHYIGSASSLNGRVLNYSFNPRVKNGFLLGVANTGTETVTLSGAPKEIRYVLEAPESWPIGKSEYNPVDPTVIVPGTFAVLDLSLVKDLKNSVWVHFTGDKRIDVAWGTAALYKNTTLIYAGTTGAVILVVASLFLLKKRKAAK